MNNEFKDDLQQMAADGEGVNETLDIATDQDELASQEKTIFTYLKEHIHSFDPTPKEYTFIDEKLEFNQGKVVIGGWLILVTISLIINTVVLLIQIIKSMDVPPMVLGTNITIFIVYAVTLYYFAKKKKRAIMLFRIVQFICLIMRLLTIRMYQEPTIIMNLIGSVIWIVYTFKSIRLKYTMVED